jgi:hypothetical protein
MALTFDGTDDYVDQSALRGVADTKQLTLSLWFKGTTDAANLFQVDGSASVRFALTIESSTGKLVVIARNSANTILWAAKTATDYTDDAWHHVVVTTDLANTTAYIYVDRVDDTVSSVGPSDGTIDLTGGTAWTIGANNGGTPNWFTGEMDDVLFFDDYFLDVTDDDELTKVVSSDGRTHATRSDQHWQNAGPDRGVKPVGYGDGGKAVTGDQKAKILLSGNFQINRGTGGNFTVSGTPDGSRGPEIYRQSALRPTQGERWFDSEQSGFSYPRSETVIEQREGSPSYGKRLGKDEVDDEFRQERPGLSFKQLVFDMPGLEDDSDEDRR